MRVRTILRKLCGCGPHTRKVRVRLFPRFDRTLKSKDATFTRFGSENLLKPCYFFCISRTYIRDFTVIIFAVLYYGSLNTVNHGLLVGFGYSLNPFGAIRDIYTIHIDSTGMVVVDVAATIGEHYTLELVQ